MDCKLRKEIEDFIFGFPIKDGTTNQERIKQLAEEYMAFRVEVLTEKQQESFCFKLIGKSTRDPRIVQSFKDKRYKT